MRIERPSTHFLNLIVIFTIALIWKKEYVQYSNWILRISKTVGLNKIYLHEDNNKSENSGDNGQEEIKRVDIKQNLQKKVRM